jgi:hypothetical protein
LTSERCPPRLLGLDIARRVIVDANGIQLTTRWMFFRKRRSLPASDVTSIQPKISMSSGSTTYYDLQAHVKGGKKISLALQVRSKRESEWLAAEMEKALGRK